MEFRGVEMPLLLLLPEMLSLLLLWLVGKSRDSDAVASDAAAVATNNKLNECNTHSDTLN